MRSTLSVVIGDDERANELLPIVNFLIDNQLRTDNPDHWTLASAGEMAVYAGDVAAAEERYRAFVRSEREAVPDRQRQADELDAAARQLRQLLAALAVREHTDLNGTEVGRAAESALAVLSSAQARV